ncbi:MAG: T9SS type A sorting domain-containing protein [Flavobacteriaceae bacterium]|nr:T9SS type A sorting domain-containing protein [Bacteroidia bacterium]MBT8287355.1 T9SS type A sorting domain-containing protein [Bacteroidia bacterium]NNF75022.1 T9SS type A sorting domain-containing protein [Flavobacteriaceae bacterium]NNK73745.1 T9SS type A sorting domain-containing protein [Flavobacteriaceae bacterium]
MKKNYLLSIIMTLIFSASWAQQCPQSIGTQSTTTVPHFKITSGTCNDYPTNITIDGSNFTKSSCNGTNLKYTLVPPDPQLSSADSFTADFGFGTCTYVNGALQTLSSEDPDLLIKTQIYPNPLLDQGSLKIRFQREVSTDIFIFDLTGKSVYTNQFSGIDQLEIETDVLSNGIYLLQIRTDLGNTTKKIVVMR